MIDRDDVWAVSFHFLNNIGEWHRAETYQKSALTLGFLPFRSHELDLGGIVSRTK